MSLRVDQALAVLVALGVPKGQQNIRTAHVLLALLELKPSHSWSRAKGEKLWRTVEIMQWLREVYSKDYAANTRETIRRFSLHQLVQAGLVLHNPDQPDRAVNSPANCYQIAPETLALVRMYGSKKWVPALDAFLLERPGLAVEYAKIRQLTRVPVTTLHGDLWLSPGLHSALIRDIIEQFAPRFVPGATLLYAGDTGDKLGYFDRAGLAALGLMPDAKGKLPDVILHDTRRNWLVLAEAASSHGPVDAKRYKELPDYP